MQPGAALSCKTTCQGYDNTNIITSTAALSQHTQLSLCVKKILGCASPNGDHNDWPNHRQHAMHTPMHSLPASSTQQAQSAHTSTDVKCPQQQQPYRPAPSVRLQRGLHSTQPQLRDTSTPPQCKLQPISTIPTSSTLQVLPASLRCLVKMVTPGASCTTTTVPNSRSSGWPLMLSGRGW